MDENKTDSLQDKVTGVNCKELKNGLKRLEWVDSAYSAAPYSISWKRDYVSLDEISSKETFLELWHLNAGKYQFVVTPSVGERSDPFYFIIPETPKYTLDVVTTKCISVVCTIVVNADGYEAELWHEESLVHSYNSNKGKFWMEYDFECGKEYMLKVYACWKGLRSEAANHYFCTDLLAATELRHILDQKQPFKKVQFTWNANTFSKKTHLKLYDGNGRLVGEEITVNAKWEFSDLLPNKVYLLKAFPNDGLKSYANFAEIKFWTAPSKPDKLEVIGKHRYVINKRVGDTDHRCPVFSLYIEIHSDYNGPFMLHNITKAKEKTTTEIEKPSKNFTLTDVDQCVQYFSARCKFTDPINGTIYYSDYSPSASIDWADWAKARKNGMENKIMAHERSTL